MPAQGLEKRPACRADLGAQVLHRHSRVHGRGDLPEFLGFNAMKALVWSGIVQGFSTPPLLLLILLMTNGRAIMGERVNGHWSNVLGWITVAVIFAARAGLVATWLI
jgi:hypothetical protein